MSSSAHGDSWRPSRSRRNLVILVVVIVLGYVTVTQVRSRSYGGSAYSVPPRLAGKPQTIIQPSGQSWTFDATRDRNNHSLTQAQCDAAFPELYHEIERSQKYWKEKQGNRPFKPKQIDIKWSGDGGMMGLIHEQQLYVTFSRGLNHFGHWKERSHATLHQIHRAILASPEPVPNIEFAIKINDVINLTPDDPSITIWAFSRNINDPVMDRVWVIPDFNFWSYPRVSGAYGDFQLQAMGQGKDKFSSKKDLLVWRGTLDFNREIREPLLAQSTAQTWSDVQRVDEDAATDVRITMPDHCRYKYSVHTEGTTWSGRLKYLLSCHQVVFIHHLNWYTHLYHLLVPSGPNQNYVQTEDDWSDLPAKINELIANPTKGKMIADNAAMHFRDRYFTPAAQTCYWRKLFHVWRAMTYEPDPWNSTTLPDGTTQKKIKGMSYEEYV
ncbi:hypothetical protein LTR78_002281 [Recurvomyces mirabilis]|uniref:Glycosyl transferase CAP10 domain-containing protein n=1 Tax=Recurvomyces mirabilis TaxID=574656 RepID=A0AAE1C4Z6_9PEZI|nr:hypothetical protein LTR78_002281 [Recurvomyces mirabilis]KAK5160736.1 hypothetical protein LTS14_001749 [Recurvomyces mirabilis]